MDDTRDPAAANEGAHPHEHHHDVEVRVRRAPKYGTFMVLGAVVGALVAWLIASLQTPGPTEAGVQVDTSGVVGLAVVAGVVLGLAAGGIVALLVDRSLAKRGQTLTAEQIDVEAAHEDAQPLEREAPADAGEAAFEHFEQPDAGAVPREGASRRPELPGDPARPDAARGPGVPGGEAQERDRTGRSGDGRPGDEQQERDRPSGA